MQRFFFVLEFRTEICPLNPVSKLGFSACPYRLTGRVLYAEQMPQRSREILSDLLLLIPPSLLPPSPWGWGGEARSAHPAATNLQTCELLFLPLFRVSHAPPPRVGYGTSIDQYRRDPRPVQPPGYWDRGPADPGIQETNKQAFSCKRKAFCAKCLTQGLLNPTQLSAFNSW